MATRWRSRESGSKITTLIGASPGPRCSPLPATCEFGEWVGWRPFACVRLLCARLTKHRLALQYLQFFSDSVSACAIDAHALGAAHWPKRRAVPDKIDCPR